MGKKRSNENQLSELEDIIMLGRKSTQNATTFAHTNVATSDAQKSNAINKVNIASSN